MAERILAICEGDAAAIHHRAAGAAGLAQKFAIESKGEADLLIVGPAPPPPGRWTHAWRLEGNCSSAAEAAARLITECGHGLVALGDTPFLRELAGRLSVRLDVPVVASVLALRRRDGTLVASRPAMSGARTANLAIGRLPALVVVNPDASEAPSTASMAVEVRALTMAPASPRRTCRGCSTASTESPMRR